LVNIEEFQVVQTMVIGNMEFLLRDIKEFMFVTKEKGF
jgi:hypothetical protein